MKPADPVINDARRVRSTMNPAGTNNNDARWVRSSMTPIWSGSTMTTIQSGSMRTTIQSGSMRRTTRAVEKNDQFVAKTTSIRARGSSSSPPGLRRVLLPIRAGRKNGPVCRTDDFQGASGSSTEPSAGVTGADRPSGRKE